MRVRLSPKTRVIRTTKSVCPVCLKQIDASIVRKNGDIFIEKACPEHGFSCAIIWRRNDPSYDDWIKEYLSIGTDDEDDTDCPHGCGLCSGHRQKTCCALVELTNRCNLSCPVCFAMSSDDSSEPSVEVLFSQFRQLVSEGNTFVQLSGGEPTVRDDLPEIIKAAKDAGCENIQLNTNGIRLADDSEYAKTLRDAGLSFVFMQFDGTDDDIYVKLRGRPLFDIKNAAINNCADAFLGVTLVPTLVPRVNDHDIGNILDFALEMSPVVRGVHFQPISYFGRYPHVPQDDDRITLPEVLQAIEKQTDNKFRVSDFFPSQCDHPLCGFHGDFVVLPKSKILKLSTNRNRSCCEDDAHLRNRRFVARRWNRSVDGDDATTDNDDFTELDAFARRIKSHGFTITAMAFQDAFNLDIGRLRRCSLHVSDGGMMIPFCAKYLTRSGDHI